MKKIKKLTLNKVIVSSLTNEQANLVKGGGDDTTAGCSQYGPPCPTQYNMGCPTGNCGSQYCPTFDCPTGSCWCTFHGTECPGTGY